MKSENDDDPKLKLIVPIRSEDSHEPSQEAADVELHELIKALQDRPLQHRYAGWCGCGDDDLLPAA